MSTVDLLAPLEGAVELAGSQEKLGDICGVSQPTIWYWLNVLKKTPAEQAPKIETALGGQVTRYQLRPDVFGEAP